MVLPEKLQGVNSIWDFILTSQNDSVVEKAIEFLNKLYIVIITISFFIKLIIQ